MFSFIRKSIRTNLFLRKFVAHTLAPSGLFDSYFRNYKLDDYWQFRVKEVLNAPDTAFIEKVPNAGQIVNGKQIMHNGLRILLGSYYGPEVSVMLAQNKGVHEPQEERVFQEVLKEMPEGATMIEMGAFWAFYSMWFHQKVKNARNFMIEPDPFNIECGIENFKLNGFKGNFTNAFLGQKSGVLEGTPIVCIDDFVATQKIDFIDMLHSDIQGFEYEMLMGAEKTINANKIKYAFISTHSNKVHKECLDFLVAHNFTIFVDIDKNQTSAEDGLIVARNKQFAGADKFEYHQNKLHNKN